MSRHSCLLLPYISVTPVLPKTCVTVVKIKLTNARSKLSNPKINVLSSGMRKQKDLAFALTKMEAREFDVTPPDWAIEQLVNAGARVFETNGEVGFEEALGLTPRKIKFALSDQKKQSIADLVGEALDADLSPIVTRELAINEAEIVCGWQQYAPGAVQKYYKTHAGERNGFMQSFLYSFEWFDLCGDEVLQ